MQDLPSTWCILVAQIICQEYIMPSILKFLALLYKFPGKQCNLEEETCFVLKLPKYNLYVSVACP